MQPGLTIRLRGSARMAFALVLALGVATPVAAHHQAGGPTSGLPIPGLTHGQMQRVAAYRGDVLALADGQFRTDPTLRRLRNFIALQHASCFWGLMPGSIADEASPFNECAHAELAAVQALLLHLSAMPAARDAARAIERRIAADGSARGVAELCGFSDEPFNTAAVIGPHWSDVPTHGPSVLALSALLAFGAAAAAGLWAGLRVPARSPA